MKKILFLIIFFHTFHSICFSENIGGIDKYKRIIYNIIFDIGTLDREAYLKIIDSINSEIRPKIAIYHTNDNDAGVTDYSAAFLIKNKDGVVLFHRFFTGSFKNDHSDVSKLPLARTPLMSREQFLDGLMQDPDGYIPLTE